LGKAKCDDEVGMAWHEKLLFETSKQIPQEGLNEHQKRRGQLYKSLYR
jgi:hypothetical protein